MRGEFILLGNGGLETILPNTVVTEGEQEFLNMMMRADNSVVAPSGSYFIGLMGDDISRALLLSSIPGEPSPTNGYGRQAVNRSATGYPTAGLVNGIPYVESQTVGFTATGGNFSLSVDRVFACSIAAGTTGTLFSISAAFPASTLVTPTGSPLNIKHRLYLR